MLKKKTKEKPEETDKLVLQTIGDDAASNGAVATQSKLGATAAYQSIARLLKNGKVKQDPKTGKLSIL